MRGFYIVIWYDVSQLEDKQLLKDHNQTTIRVILLEPFMILMECQTNMTNPHEIHFISSVFKRK